MIRDSDNKSYYVTMFDKNMTAFGGFLDYTNDLEEAKQVADSYETYEMQCAGVYNYQTRKNVYSCGSFK